VLRHALASFQLDLRVMTEVGALMNRFFTGIRNSERGAAEIFYASAA
jgi:hypothetical protein